MRPVICIITSPDPPPDGERELIERLAAAARAGVQLIQIRRPHVDGRVLLRVTEQAIRAVRGTRTRVLVNDRVDVALTAGAHGVHLRADSMSARAVRAIAPEGFLVGRSVHTAGEAVEAARQGGLDYLTFGTVFGTTSKPDTQPAGARALHEACAAVPLPVLAIGGMALSRFGAVARAGAAGFAAIGLFSGAVDEVSRVVREASREFDTPEGVS